MTDKTIDEYKKVIATCKDLFEKKFRQFKGTTLALLLLYKKGFFQVISLEKRFWELIFAI